MTYGLLRLLVAEDLDVERRDANRRAAAERTTGGGAAGALCRKRRGGDSC